MFSFDIAFLFYFILFFGLLLESFSESGEMCAMKEVTLFSDDAKSRESAKQLMQVQIPFYADPF